MKCNCRCEAVFPHGLTSGTQDRLEKLGATDQLVKFKHVPGKAQEIVSLLLIISKWAMMKILVYCAWELLLVSGMSCKDTESRSLPPLAWLWQVRNLWRRVISLSQLLIVHPEHPALLRKGRRVVLMRDGLVDPNDKVEDSFKVQQHLNKKIELTLGLENNKK